MLCILAASKVVVIVFISVVLLQSDPKGGQTGCTSQYEDDNVTVALKTGQFDISMVRFTE